MSDKRPLDIQKLREWDSDLCLVLEGKDGSYNTGIQTFGETLETLARYFFLRDTGPTYELLTDGRRGMKLYYFCDRHGLNGDRVTDMESAMEEYKRVWGPRWRKDDQDIFAAHGGIIDRQRAVLCNPEARRERLALLNIELELFGRSGGDIAVEYAPRESYLPSAETNEEPEHPEPAEPSLLAGT